MIRLNTPGIGNRLAKFIAPPVSIAISKCEGVNVLDLLIAYLNVLTGRGCGTGWDRTEGVPAAKAIRAHMKAEPVVIDCGAHRGTWVRDTRRYLGTNNGTWIAVEPNPECWPFLESIANLELIRAGAGEREEERLLYTTGTASGLVSLHPRRDSVAQGTRFTARNAQLLTLDSIIENNQLEQVDFLKMDIEGHELFALKGARTALQEKRIRALSFEFGAGNVNSRTYFRDFWELLTPLGFELRRICPGGVTAPVAVYYEDLEFFRGVSNYVAVLKEY
jgi:FkbM family methyltransferase